MASADARASVSVALCTYNGERWVGEQLSSILDQSVPVAEVVVVDDGSTDGTLDVIAQVAARSDIPVRVAATERAGGIRANMERTLRACTGDIIAMSDQDDVWHPDRIEQVLEEFAARPDALLVHADARIVGADGSPSGGTLLGRLGASEEERAALVLGEGWPVLLRRNLVTGATAAIRRELLDLALPLGSSWVHDEWLAIIAASRGGVVLIDEPLIDYRVHGSNQIGAEERTLGYRVRRMLASRRDRLEGLARRGEELVERLEALGADEAVLAGARAKRDFDRERAEIPASRWRRIGPVRRAARGGRYARLASQGRLDMVRDLLAAP
ncbi:MAG: glycosyltransferase family 2 protein [Actinomycetes bacterium]